MDPPVQPVRSVGAETLRQNSDYDAVIIGAGIAGAIIAAELGKAGKRVLVVEAAAGSDDFMADYSAYLDDFYRSVSRDNQSPFPGNPNAPMPRKSDLRRLAPGEASGSAYMVQSGPYVTDTVYSRAVGGTSIHWEAKTPRMLPDDFELRTRYGVGADWPIEYAEMEDDYQRAEAEMGVSADVADQEYLGLKFPSDYVYPMKGLPLSYLDRMVAASVNGTTVELLGEHYPLDVRPFPQGRNSIPNPAYDGGRGYSPQGAVAGHQIDTGGRCQGNTNCVPICPVQAKYHSGKTLAKALRSGTVDIVTKAVAARIIVDSASGRITGIETKLYHDPSSPECETLTLTAKVFILAGNAIENPKLLLASGLHSTSGLVGRNLMDHVYLLNWGLMPQLCGTMRGTACTGGIVGARGGAFRNRQAAFSVDIHNDGWGRATGSPQADIIEFVDAGNKFGGELRRALIDRISKQLLLAAMIEVPPVESNRVSVDPAYRDALGNLRPVISFDVPEYTLRGAAFARRLSKTVFARSGAEDHTAYDPTDFGLRTFEGVNYVIRGGHHLAGTHVMGHSRATSVVDTDQRSWDHPNLFLTGGGSMPTIGTANVSLTLAALCYRSARAIVRQLAA